jgi:hypothetical protein
LLVLRVLLLCDHRFNGRRTLALAMAVEGGLALT